MAGFGTQRAPKHASQLLKGSVTVPSGQPDKIAGSVLPLKKAEELLQTLQDVVSARIVSDEHGAVDSIHVLVTGTSTPKQVVRNIESALMAQLGMRVDHRKISVATSVRRPPVTGEHEVIEEQRPPQGAEKPPESGRVLYFEDVEVKGSRLKGVACKVTLRRGKDRFVGEAEGFESDRSRVEIAARAAVAAVAMCDTELRLAFEGAKVIDAFDRQLVLVGVMIRHDRNNILLAGSCEVRESLETASALAVLNATNRWVEGVR